MFAASRTSRRPTAWRPAPGSRRERRIRATAERCADALDGLPPKAKADYFGAGTIIPEVVGALAAVGNWEQALALIRAQPRDGQKAAFVKLVKYGHSPELLPVARKVFVSGSPESGAYLRQDAGSRWTAGGGGVLRLDGGG